MLIGQNRRLWKSITPLIYYFYLFIKNLNLLNIISLIFQTKMSYYESMIRNETDENELKYFKK
jgi:hypothetical protein